MESALGAMGRGKREERPRPPRAFYFFSIIAIFIGIPSGSLYGGEISNHSFYARPAVCPRLKNQAVRGETYIIG